MDLTSPQKFEEIQNTEEEPKLKEMDIQMPTVVSHSKLEKIQTTEKSIELKEIKTTIPTAKTMSNSKEIIFNTKKKSDETPLGNVPETVTADVRGELVVPVQMHSAIQADPQNINNFVNIPEGIVKDPVHSEVHLGGGSGGDTPEVVVKEGEIEKQVNDAGHRKRNHATNPAHVSLENTVELAVEEVTEDAEKEEIFSTIQNFVEASTEFTLKDEIPGTLSATEKIKDFVNENQSDAIKDSEVNMELLDIDGEMSEERIEGLQKTVIGEVDETEEPVTIINEEDNVELTTTRRLPEVYPGLSSNRPPPPTTPTPAGQPQIINHNMNLQTALIINTLSKVTSMKIYAFGFCRFCQMFLSLD